METVVKVIGLLVLAAVIVFVVAAVLALPVMLIVNYVLAPSALVAVFGGPLTFWKAFWLNFVCGILFKTSVTTKSD